MGIVLNNNKVGHRPSEGLCTRVGCYRVVHSIYDHEEAFLVRSLLWCIGSQFIIRTIEEHVIYFDYSDDAWVSIGASLIRMR